MHGEDLVVGAGREEMVERLHELDPHQHGLGDAHQQKGDRRDDVHEADLLVVDGGDPAQQAMVSGIVRRVRVGGHCNPIEVDGDGVRVGFRQVHVGHVAVRLEALRIAYPLRQVVEVVVEHAGADGLAVRDVCQVRAHLPVGPGAGDAVAVPAGLGQEEGFSVGGLSADGRRGDSKLAFGPGGEIRGRIDDHANAHQGVLGTAIFGAGAEVGAGARGLNPEIVAAARNGVHLGAEIGHPEIVDDVAGLGGKEPLHPFHHVQLVGGDDAGGRVVILPPPLVSGYDDIGRVRADQRTDDRHRASGEHQQTEQDGRRDERPQGFQPRIALILNRLARAGPVAESDGGVDHQPRDRQEDDGGDHQVDVKESRDGLRLRGVGVKDRGIEWPHFPPVLSMLPYPFISLEPPGASTLHFPCGGALASVNRDGDPR